jgi:hypothetical protein
VYNLSNHLQTKHGKPVPWGNTPYSMVYGPQGWCEADEGKIARK